MGNDKTYGYLDTRFCGGLITNGFGMSGGCRGKRGRTGWLEATSVDGCQFGALAARSMV
jgi:hypothetical protein